MRTSALACAVALALLGGGAEATRVRVPPAQDASGQDIAYIVQLSLVDATGRAVQGLTLPGGRPIAEDVPTMRGGIAIATHSLETWHGIFGTRDESRAASKAFQLFAWLLDQPGAAAAPATMLHIGPKALRSKDARDAALALLSNAGLVRSNGAKWGAQP